MLYKPLLHCNSHLNSCGEVTRRSASVIKVGMVDVDICVSSHLKRRAGLDYRLTASGY